MNKREPYTRKHVHRWLIISRKEPSNGLDYWGYQQTDPTPLELVRECDDCGERMKALVESEDEHKVVKGYEAVSDLDWKEV